MAKEVREEKRAWVTLVTRASYLPGAITLAHSLRSHNTSYPLIVLVTPSLPQSSVRALELESTINPLLKVHHITPLLPTGPVTLIAERFEDTWTKLRCFELFDYTTLCFFDADITIYRSIDGLFDMDLPTDHIAANHACVCNLDHDSWAPADWTRQNCAYTALSHPSALTASTPVPHSSTQAHKDYTPTHTLLNGGVFLFHPSPDLWESMLHVFTTSPALGSYQFPDQDFLAAYFRDRWLPLPWSVNALKTMRYWHENVWRDDEVRALHYIVDKPWTRRVGSDGVAGHLGRDGATHRWWWRVWEEWTSVRKGMEVLALVEDLVAQPLDEESDRRQGQENRERGYPVPVPPH